MQWYFAILLHDVIIQRIATETRQFHLWEGVLRSVSFGTCLYHRSTAYAQFSDQCSATVFLFCLWHLNEYTFLDGHCGGHVHAFVKVFALFLPLCSTGAQLHTWSSS